MTVTVFSFGEVQRATVIDRRYRKIRITMPLLAWFHALDLQALYLINQTWSTPWLDPLMARVSDWNSFRIPVAITVILALIFGGFRARQMIVLMAACLIIGDSGISNTFKSTIHRPRPNETEPHLRVLTVHEVSESIPHHVIKGKSFTSSHACNNVALAMIGCAIFGRWALWLWPWAALVSYSRVYVGSHYPSDILGSWIVAIVYSYFICRGAAWLWQHYAPKRCPQTYANHPVLFPLWQK